MLYQMIYKYTPWTGRSPCDLLNNILIRPLKFPDEETKIVNQDIKKILSSMLEIDEAKRISWNELFKYQISFI
jgi:serine/threonine protein kinase